MAENVKQVKSKEQRVPLLIPIDPLNPSIHNKDIYINDMKYTIPLGKMVYVPQVVADVYEQSMQAEAVYQEHSFEAMNRDLDKQ